MNELWKDISGYEGLYKISNKGRVKSIKKTLKYSDGRIRIYYEKILINSVNPSGYEYVTLCKDVKRKHLVHRLVAYEFVNNVYKYNIVDHKDRNRRNNYEENLRWATASMNSNNSTRKNIKTSKYIGVYKYYNKWISRVFNKQCTFVGSYKSEHEAAVARDEYIKTNKLGRELNFI